MESIFYNRINKYEGGRPALYKKMWIDQNGCCAICGIDIVIDAPSWAALVIDHDHQTGLIRALLCQRCNSLVGALESDNHEAALLYIEKHNAARPVEFTEIKARTKKQYWRLRNWFGHLHKNT